MFREVSDEVNGGSTLTGRVRGVRSAAAFVDRVGVAVVFPSDDLVLPSLWEVAVGSGELIVFVHDEQGKRVLSPELERVWSLHDWLAAERLACVGKHVRNRLALISLAMLPAFYALTGRAGDEDDFQDSDALSPLELDLAEALLEDGPQTGPELRGRLGLRDARRVKRALEALQRKLVITRAGEAEQPQGWAAAIFDLVARRYPECTRCLPGSATARREVADAVLRTAGELSAADLAAVLGQSRAEAAAALDDLVDTGRACRHDQQHPTTWAWGACSDRTH